MSDEKEQVIITPGDVGELKLSTMPKLPTKDIFCAACQKDTAHTVKRSGSEVKASCTVCQRTLHFPIPKNAEDFASMLEAHKKSNEGHISVEVVAAKDAELDADFNKALGLE